MPAIAVASPPADKFDGLHSLADEELCRRFSKGDEAAFAVLRGRHIGRVRRAAASVLGDPNESEDVAQEVMLIVWKQAGSWEQGAAKFSTWLHRIALNKAIDFRRRTRCVPNAQEDLASSLEEAPNSSSSEQEDSAHRAQLHQALKVLLQRLPAAQRDVLTHFYFEEASVASIAHGLQISEQAVRSLLKRGKAALRAFLLLTDPSLRESVSRLQSAEDHVLALTAVRSS